MDKHNLFCVVRSARSKAHGFMMLEALIAILIFSLGILGVIGFQSVSSKMTADARYRTEAAMYAEELVARMRVSDRASLVADYATGGSVLNAWKTNRLLKAGAGLPAATVTTRITADAATNTFEAAITITWLPPGVNAAEQSSYTFTTLALIEP